MLQGKLLKYHYHELFFLIGELSKSSFANFRGGFEPCEFCCYGAPRIG